MAYGAMRVVENVTENTKRLSEIVSQTVRVVIEDGRVIIGKLYCVDKERNLVIEDAVEITVIRGQKSFFPSK